MSNKRKLKVSFDISIKEIKSANLEECIKAIDFQLATLREDVIKAIKPYVKK